MLSVRTLFMGDEEITAKGDGRDRGEDLVFTLGLICVFSRNKRALPEGTITAAWPCQENPVQG
jgi:hypothetical protein